MGGLLAGRLSGRAPETSVWISSPNSEEPAFGETTISAEVVPLDDVARVEFVVDGEIVGQLEAPPFTLVVDVGPANREHRFEVRAHSVSGPLAESVIHTPMIRVDEALGVELQELYVTITDEQNRVPELRREDFEIRDNGDRQEIVTFARGDVPLTAAILVDSSMSMRGQRMRFAREGATAFTRGMGPIDEASLLFFSDRLIHTTPFSNDGAALTAGLDSVAAAGGTALFDHLYLALRRLEGRKGRRVVVLLSDGIDSHSALRMEDVSWIAGRTRALIYWIRSDVVDSGDSLFSAWKDPDLYRREYRQLSDTVVASGGRILTLERIEDTAPAIQEVLIELRNQYVLGYQPSNARNNGSWHRVQLRLSRTGLVARTRGGYIDY